MQDDNFNKLKQNPSLQRYVKVDHDIVEDNYKLEQMLKREKLVSENVNQSQPSNEFFKKISKDTKLYFEKKKEAISAISPNLGFSLSKIFVFNNLEDEMKTRCGANPQFMSTSHISQADPLAAMYITEKERFNVRGNVEVDFQAKEKFDKQKTNIGRVEKLKDNKFNMKERSFMNDVILEEKRNYSLLQRSKKQLKYEAVNFIFKLKLT